MTTEQLWAMHDRVDADVCEHPPDTAEATVQAVERACRDDAVRCGRAMARTGQVQVLFDAGTGISAVVREDGTGVRQRVEVGFVLRAADVVLRSMECTCAQGFACSHAVAAVHVARSGVTTAPRTAPGPHLLAALADRLAAAASAPVAAETVVARACALLPPPLELRWGR
jgi:hypothetical protein